MPLRMYNLPKRKTCRKITTDNAPPEGHIIHEQASLACEGCLWPQVAESSRITNSAGQQKQAEDYKSTETVNQDCKS